MKLFGRKTLTLSLPAPPPPDPVQIAHDELEKAAQAWMAFEFLHSTAEGSPRMYQGDGQGGLRIPSPAPAERERLLLDLNEKRHRFEILLNANVQEKRSKRNDYFASPGKPELAESI